MNGTSSDRFKSLCQVISMAADAQWALQDLTMALIEANMLTEAENVRDLVPRVADAIGTLNALDR